MTTVYIVVREDDEYPGYIDGIFGVYARADAAAAKAEQMNALFQFSRYKVESYGVEPGGPA